MTASTLAGVCRADLDAVVDRLHATGIDVTADLDDKGRVCVHPTCACSDRDHRRVMAAFLAIASVVRWECMAAAPYAREVSGA